MQLRNWLDKWLEPLHWMFAKPAPVPVDDRPRCPDCGRLLLRFQANWLCSDCRCQVRPGARPA